MGTQGNAGAANVKPSSLPEPTIAKPAAGWSLLSRKLLVTDAPQLYTQDGSSLSLDE
jgi:hypothetical protein